MVSIVIIFFVLVVAGAIIYLDRYKDKKFIAEQVDGSKADSNYMTGEMQSVVMQLNDVKSLRLNKYNNRIILPDGQEVSYRTDSMEVFQTDSKLTFVPTKTEWKILVGIVKKLRG